MRQNPVNGKIQSPYLWRAIDERIIREHPVVSHNSWTNLNYHHRDIKTRIKTHYLYQQNGHCVYCRLPINFQGWDEPIEHIIHKEFKYIYMYTPVNLAISCKHCNTKKSRKHALAKPYRNLPVFPAQSIHYRIIHPHFDNFEDYIVLEDDLFYRAIRRDKGLLHIMFFSLNQEVILMKRARDKKISQIDYYKRLIHKISDNSTHRWEKRRYRQVANSIIDLRQL